MKAKKLRRVVEDVLEYRDAVARPPTVTVDAVEVDFAKRRVTWRGDVIEPSTDVEILTFPLLSGEVLLRPARR